MSTSLSISVQRRAAEDSDSSAKHTTMAVSFHTVIEQQDAFRNIAEMLGNPAEMLHLEKTCRGTRKFFAKTDGVWMSCKDEYKVFKDDSRLPNAREKVCTAWMLRRCEIEQEKTGNILVEEYNRDQSSEDPAWH